MHQEIKVGTKLLVSNEQNEKFVGLVHERGAGTVRFDFRFILNPCKNTQYPWFRVLDDGRLAEMGGGNVILTVLQISNEP
jgi:hypothetical protein